MSVARPVIPESFCNILALLGEMFGEQLPTLIVFDDDPTEDLANTLGMKTQVIPTTAQVDAHYVNPLHLDLMVQPSAATGGGGGGVEACIALLCPIPLAWAPYFLDFKKPHAALLMGRQLMGTLVTAEE